MAQANPNDVCFRVIQGKEIQRSKAGLDDDEDVLLTLARCYFETFAMPETQSWMRCFDLAACHFGADTGAVVSQRLLFALQAMRCSRRSVFGFNAPHCKGCSKIMTEHERRLMTVIKSTRHKQFGTMRMELMMLCEGNDTALAETCFDSLCAALPTVTHYTQQEDQSVSRTH